jgi:hypothetical protein
LTEELATEFQVPGKSANGQKSGATPGAVLRRRARGWISRKKLPSASVKDATDDTVKWFEDLAAETESKSTTKAAAKRKQTESPTDDDASPTREDRVPKRHKHSPIVAPVAAPFVASATLFTTPSTVSPSTSVDTKHSVSKLTNIRERARCAQLELEIAKEEEKELHASEALAKIQERIQTLKKQLPSATRPIITPPAAAAAPS